MPSLVLRQWVSVIDERTTLICLDVAGQTRLTDKPFDTLNGQFDNPPAHVHCRAMVVPWMVGSVGSQREEANAELQRRPIAQRDPRKVRLPPKPRVRRKLTASRRARRSGKR